MSTYDNGAPMPEVWQGEPRPSPFDVKPTPTSPAVTLATAELEPRGSE